MKKLFTLTLASLMLLSLCACGASNYTADTAMNVVSPSYNEAKPAAAADVGGFSMANSSTTAMPESAPLGDINSEKLIYSADATVETTDFDASIASLNELIAHYKGFIEQSSMNGSNYYSISRGYSAHRSAVYVLRVPSESFSTIMSELSTLGNVPYSYIYTTNITADYYDTASRLKAYQTQENTLLALLEKAESIEDVLAVERELSEIRYKIESLQGTLQSWDRQVSYSSINLTIDEVSVYTPEATLGFGTRLINAFKSGINGFVDFLKSAALFLAESLPALLCIAIVICAITIPVRRKIRKRRAKKAENAK